MGQGRFGPTAQQLRHLFEGRSIAGASEWQLLHRYLDRRDEVAFEAIVARHGPMVLGVCRRVLSDARDVEDAFQATFLILAEKGRTLAEGDPFAHWLYGVAHRVALRARSSAARRHRIERDVRPTELASPDDPSSFELASVLDEELARLPAKYRAPVVLCYLEGQTHEEAARQLGWPLGSVKGRLARARDLLKERLTRRGVTPGGFLLLAWGSQSAVPRTLMELTTRVVDAGRSAGVVSATVSSLVSWSLSTMFLNKLKAAGMVVLVLGTGAAVMAYQASQGQGQQQVKIASGPQAPSRVMPSKLATPSDDVADWPAGWPDLTRPLDNSPMTPAILKALEEPLTLHFPTDTPVSDVLSYIRAATKRPELPNGIMIYIDPQGLQDADKTEADTVKIDIEGVPLKKTLALVLKQLSLYYRVKDGLMIITSAGEDEGTDPFSVMEEKAMKGELTREQYRQLIEALKLKRQVEELMSYKDGSQ